MDTLLAKKEGLLHKVEQNKMNLFIFPSIHAPIHPFLHQIFTKDKF